MVRKGLCRPHIRRSGQNSGVRSLRCTSTCNRAASALEKPSVRHLVLGEGSCSAALCLARSNRSPSCWLADDRCQPPSPRPRAGCKCYGVCISCGAVCQRCGYCVVCERCKCWVDCGVVYVSGVGVVACARLLFFDEEH